MKEDHNDLVGTKKEDMVNAPKHYQSPFPIMYMISGDSGSAHRIHIQALDVIKAWGLQKSFYLGNVIKYILRSGKKDPAKELEDLKKARYYLDCEIQEREQDANNTR